MVEFALIVPALLAMTALVVVGGIGFELNRKVTLTMRTLTDLATQQTNIGTSSTTYTYTNILNAASLVVAPYDPSKLSMVLSEVQTNGTTSATVVWSQANAQGAALAAGSTVTVPSNLSASGYLILGQVTYKYNPLNIFVSASPITLSNSLYMAPRVVAGHVNCCS